MGWARHFSLSDLARRALATSDRLLWRAGRSPSRTGWTGWAGLVGLGNYFGCPKTFFKKVLAKPARLPYSNFSREGAQRRSKLGLRLVVGQRILVPSTGVRLSQSQPFATSTHMARSSSGSGRRPLKAEITSSNLVRATMSSSGRPYKAPLHMARSSSGSGRRPLKAEITSSNLVRATKRAPVSFRARRFFLP